VIPRIIHYVWLGQGPLGELGEKCLLSWRNRLPGWKFMRWDEGNSPMGHPFVQAMVDRRLFAFASDYIRLQALREHGGLYLDTDVELLQDPSEFLAFDGLILGLLTLQNRLAKCSVATNFIAAPPQSPHSLSIQRVYETMQRAVMNNTLFTREILPRFRQMEIPPKGRFDYLEVPECRLYHPDFFNPVLQEERGRTIPDPKPRSVALHYGTGAWFGKQDPDPLWRRMFDLRPDRRLLRPIERQLKRIVRRSLSVPPSPGGGGEIPRILHYVWLGKKPLSPVGQKCLQSWKEHLPGWQIRRWDESNSPVEHPFVRQMISDKKYAFASDYIRLFALAQMGGLYVDTDLELIGNPERLLNHPCVLAFLSAQNRPSKNSAAMGFFASVPQHPWVVELQQMYDGLDVAIMNTTLTTQSLRRRGLRSLDRQSAKQDFWDLGDIRIYHSDFFYPEGGIQEGFQRRPRTLGLHHAEGSWHGQAAPLPRWKRLLDFRLDRKILRPIEQAVKKIRG